MARSVLGVVIGVIVWMVAFYALASTLAQLWPDYAVHARQWMREDRFTFPAPMACCNLVLWALAEIGAGWASATVSRRSAAVWVVAMLVGAYLAAIHLLLYWPRFPWWYNLGVVIPAVPAVLLGAGLSRALRQNARR